MPGGDEFEDSLCRNVYTSPLFSLQFLLGWSLAILRYFGVLIKYKVVLLILHNNISYKALIKKNIRFNHCLKCGINRRANMQTPRTIKTNRKTPHM